MVSEVPILALDMKDWSKQSPEIRRITQRSMQEIVDQAIYDVLPLRNSELINEIQSTGDGLFLVMSTFMPADALVVVRKIQEHLRLHNARYVDTITMRFRMVMVVGDVEHNLRALNSSAFIDAARLLDSGPLRERLDGSQSASVLAVSTLFKFLVDSKPRSMTGEDVLRDVNFERFVATDKHGFEHVGFFVTVAATGP